MNGAKIIGGDPENGRVENDFYATDPDAVRKLLAAHKFDLHKVLEPCVGQGHIANTIKEYCKQADVTGIDILDRGWPHCIIGDFLTHTTDEKYTAIITNPPFTLANDFIQKSLDLLEDGGQMAMLLKIQFLEGQCRQELFEKMPPRYIYVFRNRVPIFNNGSPVNPKTGKRWATTMCFAWYVWEKGTTAEPVVRWL